eukprot:scaffold69216_cov32-Tisochrysis_lutea.AAC.2
MMITPAEHWERTRRQRHRHGRRGAPHTHAVAMRRAAERIWKACAGGRTPVNLRIGLPSVHSHAPRRAHSGEGGGGVSLRDKLGELGSVCPTLCCGRSQSTRGWGRSLMPMPHNRVCP